jgi:hypothetical protein
VYWVDEADGIVTRVSKRGGTTMMLFSGTGSAFAPGTSVAVDGTDIYWTSQVATGPADHPKLANALTRMDKNGGKPTIVSSSPTSNQKCVVTDARDMYWVNGNAIMKAPKAGGAPTPIAAGQNGPTCVASDDKFIYWSSAGSSGKSYKDGAIIAAPKGGGGATKTVANSQEKATNVQVDDTTLYWVSADKIMAMPKGGGEAKVLATAGAPVSDIVVDHGYVYFTWYTAGADGTVARVSREGGAVQTIASNQPQPAGLAVDDTSVFWSCRGTEEKKYTDGTVNKADKP